MKANYYFEFCFRITKITRFQSKASFSKFTPPSQYSDRCVYAYESIMAVEF